MVLARLPWARTPPRIDVPSWTDSAACKDLTPKEADQLFFPARGHSATKGQVLCSSCPVSKECLEMALTAGVEFGIWGGVSPSERRALVRERGAGCPPRAGRPREETPGLSCSWRV